MNFDLLSQNLVLILCALSTGLALFIILRITRPTHKKKAKPSKKDIINRKLFTRVAILSVCGSLLLTVIIRYLLSDITDSSLPNSFFFMILPFTLSISLLVLSIKRKLSRLWIVALGCMVVTLVFSLVLVNDYYRFYPTIGEVFGKVANVQTNLNSNDAVDINISNKISNKTQLPTIQSDLVAANNNQTKGTVYSINIPGKISGFKARGAYVYVPAIYSKVSDLSLPVIVLTAGVPGIPENWLGSGLQATVDEFASSHNGITPLIFMVDNLGSISNDTECVNSPRGNVETYLTVDVPNYIKANFRVIQSPNNWAIGGLSMGGMCAVMLTLRHPDVYRTFLDYGGEIGPEVGTKQKTIDTLFGGSEADWAAHQPSVLLTTKNYKNSSLGGFFGVGSQDTLNVTQAISQLTLDSQNAGITTVSEVVDGPHTFNVWQELFKDSLPWVSNRIGATECNVACE